MNALVLGERTGIRTAIVAFVTGEWTFSGMDEFVLTEWTPL